MATETSELRVAVDSPAKWTRRLTITVPAQRVAQERESVTKQIAGRLNLPGFRKGKVPPAVIEKRFGQAIESELLERLVGNAYKQALQQEGLTPITQGEVENLDYAPGADLTFHVGFDIRPVVELTRIGGFQVRREAPTLGEDEVDRVLERLRSQHAAWEPVSDETPTAGDMVAVEITALDTEGEDAQPRPYRFVLGEGQAVAPVEDAIRTLRPEQEEEFTLALGGDGEGAESEPKRLRIRLNEIKRPILPAVDDEFAKMVGEFDSLDTLRQRVREDLEREAQAEAERTLRQRLVDEIVAANPLEIPASMVDQYLARALPDREGADAQRLAETRELARPGAEAAIRRLLVIEKVAELEGLHATQDEIDARVEQLAERWGRSPGEVWAQLQKSGRLQVIEEEITEDRVFDYLKSQSTIQ